MERCGGRGCPEMAIMTANTGNMVISSKTTTARIEIPTVNVGYLITDSTKIVRPGICDNNGKYQHGMHQKRKYLHLWNHDRCRMEIPTTNLGELDKSVSKQLLQWPTSGNGITTAALSLVLQSYMHHFRLSVVVAVTFTELATLVIVVENAEFVFGISTLSIVYPNITSGFGGHITISGCLTLSQSLFELSKVVKPRFTVAISMQTVIISAI